MMRLASGFFFGWMKPDSLTFMSSGGLAARYGVAKSFTHSRLDAQHVVVDCEHALLQGRHTWFEDNLDLGIVDAREVAGAGWLVLLWLQCEGIAVNAWVGVAGVVVVWLGDVEVLAWLLGEAILAVENQLEVVQGTHLDTQGTCGRCSCCGVCGYTILGPHAVGAEDVSNQAVGTLVISGEDMGGTDDVTLSEVVGQGKVIQVGGDVHVGAVGGEIPHGVVLGG